MPELRIKRAYRAARRSDGKRVLVDGLWPRGMTKERLRLDHWWKDLAPSAELRKWFGHDVARWEEFRQRYIAELAERPEEMERLRTLAAAEPVTLIYGAKDEEHNNAVVLKQLVDGSGGTEQ